MCAFKIFFSDKGMKKKIHRMELRLTALKRQQEKMVSEMERSISKHDTIKLANTSSKTKSAMTQATLEKRIMEGKVQLKRDQSDSKKLGVDIESYEVSNQVLLSELEHYQRSYASLEESKNSLESQAQDALLQRQLNLDTILLHQDRAKAYSDLLNGRYRANLSADKINSESTRQDDKQRRLCEALHRLQQQSPEHATFFERLLSFASSA